MNRFNNVIIGQKAFIVRGNKILILKRKEVDVFRGFWDVPGGKLEDGDSLLTGIAREIKEEAGLDLTKIILVLSSTKFDGQVADRPVVIRNIYLCSAIGQVEISKEHSEFKWVDVEDVAKYKFPDQEDIQDVIHRLPGVVKSLDKNHIYSKIY